MYIKTCTRKKGGKTYKTHYLAEGYRDKVTGVVKHKHILSLSKMTDKMILAIKAVLNNDTQIEKVRLEDLEVVGAKEYGSVAVFAKLFDQYFTDLIDAKYLAELKAIVINKIFDPKSKNSLNNWVKQVDLGLPFSDTDKLYESMDYLEESQAEIEKKLLLGRSTKNLELVLYDLTSTYFEGKGAENLCKYGYSRDHRSDRVQINIGLITTEDGTPVGVEVLAGNMADKSTMQDKIKELKDKFNLKNITFVFDRGMKSKANLKSIQEQGYDYVTALSHAELKTKAESNQSIQMSIFDKKNLAEFTIDDKKYLLCHNPSKQLKDQITRNLLITKTESKLIAIQNLKKEYTDNIIQDKVSKIINHTKCEKYLTYQIANGQLTFLRKQEVIDRDEQYDGFYMIETTNTKLVGDQAERTYKSLQLVERAFDSLKNHLEIRPVFHYKESRIKGHIFSCFMAYYLLHKFKQQTKELLTNNSLDDLLTELKCIKKTYFKLDKFILEKITNRTETQQDLLNIFQIRVL
ncbi:MAG: IS1634 family transposase [Campylobacterota bacterium]